MKNNEHCWVHGITESGNEYKITSISKTDRSIYYGYVLSDAKFKKVYKNKFPDHVEDYILERF